LLVTTDCNGDANQPCTWIGDAYCDDGTFFSTDLNCAATDFDGGDCEYTYDCDGRLALLNLVGDDSCQDGTTTLANFDCIDWEYDGGDCAPKDCSRECIDEYPSDDGTCQDDFNCKKFDYSFDQCAPPNICPDDWYDTGRENHRCSTNTGGDRFASVMMVPFDVCECHTWCLGKAEEKNTVLTAFDHYSDKCRCWEGDCTQQTLLECKADGKNASSFLGDDGRCPAAVYFPHESIDDCHPEGYVQDVTMYAGYFYENHYDDGYCDNAQFGGMNYTEYDFGDAPRGDYSCGDFDNDGEDCLVATCDEIFEATNFAVLDEANLVCDGHDNEVYRETEWTTACDCYDFCAPNGETESLLFQRNNQGMCQCLTHCTSQSSCGLESECQMFYVDRVFDCCGTDWTLGSPVSELTNYDEMGEFYTHYVNSQQESARNNKIISYDGLVSISQTEGYCVPAFMCPEHDYSFGDYEEATDTINSTPCFECLVSTDEQLNEFTINETRCDFASNNASRYYQLTDFYAIGSGRNPYDLDDYCECELTCRWRKFEEFSQGSCGAVAGMKGYYEWLESEDTAFAVDSYKGDCRCWDYCTLDTLWTCTVGANDRCQEPVAVLLWENPGVPPVLPPERPNGGTN